MVGVLHGFSRDLYEDAIHQFFIPPYFAAIFHDLLKCNLKA